MHLIVNIASEMVKNKMRLTLPMDKIELLFKFVYCSDYYFFYIMQLILTKSTN